MAFSLFILLISLVFCIAQNKVHIKYVAPVLNQVALLALVPLKLVNPNLFSLLNINFILLLLMTELNLVVMCSRGFQYFANVLICVVYGACVTLIENGDSASFELLADRADVETSSWLLFKILNPIGLDVHFGYYVHFYSVLAIFLLVNLLWKLNMKSVVDAKDEEQTQIEEHHSKALEILDLDTRLFVVYDDNEVVSDDEEDFKPSQVNYISNEFRKKFLNQKKLFAPSTEDDQPLDIGDLNFIQTTQVVPISSGDAPQEEQNLTTRIFSLS